MTKNALLNEISYDLNILNGKELENVFYFIKFIRNKNEIDPTLEILENPGHLKAVRKGLHEKKYGKVSRWEDVK